MTSLAARRCRRADAGSMPLALLLTLVGVTLTALLVPVVITQVNATRSGIRRDHALAAAQAGLEVALGHVRAANDGAGNGVPTKLPCGPLESRVSAAGSARYRVTIDYLAADPQGQTDAWVTANRISCTPATGPASSPTFVLLTSLGTDSATGSFDTVPTRRLSATYGIVTSAQTVVGGVIRVYSGGTGTDLCLQAESSTPPAGSDLLVRACDTASAAQRFVYNANLTLMLAASKTTLVPLGMCLDSGTPHAAGQVVKLQPCAPTTRPQQQWIFNAYANFEGTADGFTPDTYCLNVKTPGAPGGVVLGSVATSTCRGAYDTRQTFAPDAGVGAGAAGSWTGQLVNYGEFARCVAVTNSSVTSTYLVAWPCTQSPDPTAVAWDQQWTVPPLVAGTPRGTGVISTDIPTDSAGPYCLRSPGSTAPLQYVTLTACPTSGDPPPNLTWTVSTNTGTFATSYRIEDAFGYCLAPTDPAAAPASRDLHEAARSISKLIVVACDGSTLQKWNAPPNTIQKPALTNLRER